MESAFYLENLPVEVLANILNGAFSWAAIELWKTGSSTIRAKLANGGIRELALVDLRPGSLSQWPQCINEFRLRSLSFQVSSTSTDTTMLHAHLRSLDSGLQRLVLHIPGAAGAIFGRHLKSADSDAPSLSPPIKRPKTGRSGSRTQDEAFEYWDLNATHAVLEHLELVDPIFAFSEIVGFSRLPRALHTLKVLLRPGLRNWSLAELPPNLTSLSLPFSSIDAAALETMLPKSLTHLSGDSLGHDALLALAKSPRLLPHLERFPESESRLQPIYTTLMDFKVPLPYNLHSLVLHGEEEEPQEIELPNKLRVLSAVRKLQSQDLDSATLKQYLPTTLTELHANEINWKAVTTSVWPSTLTKISVVRDGKFNAQCFALLPRGLQHLNIGSSFPMLPHGKKGTLAEFKASSILILQENDRETWSKWKQTELFRSLKQGYAQLAEISRYTDQVDSGALCGLPLSLTKLSMFHMPKALAKVLVLPPSLRELSVEEGNDALLLNPIWTLLPRSFTSMSLEELDTIPTNPNILTAEPSSSSALFKMQNITRLVISASSSSLMELLIPCLPRSLRFFELEANSEEVDAAVLRHLPPKLEGLFLGSIALRRSVDWTLGLPRSITYFSIDETSLHGPELAHLPPQLETLTAPINACLEHITTLPRNLRKLELVKPLSNAEKWSEDELTHEQWKLLLWKHVPFWKAIRQPLQNLKALLYPVVEELEPETAKRGRKRSAVTK